MQLLRNPEFQKLLLDYPRARRTFLTAIEDKDLVSSQKLERYGKFDSAEDYLDAFDKFVRANADKVSALSVLLQHPADWRPAVMDGVREEPPNRHGPSSISCRRLLDHVPLVPSVPSRATAALSSRGPSPFRMRKEVRGNSPSCAKLFPSRPLNMSTETILIIVVVVLLLGGGGFWFRGRR